MCTLASDYTNSNDYVSKAGIKQIGARMLRNVKYNGAAWKEVNANAYITDVNGLTNGP